jgi:hypothetical protein
VLILAPTLAYLGVSYLSGLGSSPAPAATTPATAAPSATATPTPTAAPSLTPTATPTPTQAQGDVRRDAPVFVLDGSDDPAAGASASGRLAADGFVTVNVSEYTRPAPAASTVYYNNAALADTARQVGTVLGIAQLVELADATTSVAIVLRSDYVP